jgi:diguanylate cyclase (GGDEF)-like protein
MASTGPTLPSALERQNEALRQQLDTLLREARSNEDKQKRFDALEHRLIGARSLVELVRLLLVDYKAEFGIDFINLCLVDSDLEATRILDVELRADVRLQQDLALVQSPAALSALYGGDVQPTLAPFVPLKHGRFFGSGALAQIRSVALLPLSRRGELIGGLHFGSREADRYEPGSGTHFLARLADIVAVCLESALTQERLTRAGLTDALTGVHNRRFFEHRGPIEVAQARRYRHSLACLFLDIDSFKRINDSHGHAAGDAVLTAVGGLIQGQLRAGDTVAHYGGEEFVVLLPQASAPHASEIAERIRASIAAKPCALPGGEAIAVTISIGLAMLADDAAARDPAELAARMVAAADQAMYAAKQQGRNRVVLLS